MYLGYDEAVQVGLNAYISLEYSSSCLSAFRVASREFKDYMKNISLPYSQELAQQWINNSKGHWSNYKLKSSRKAISVLVDIMEHGCVTTSLQTKNERIPPYNRLQNWSRTLLDNFLSTLTCAYGTPYLTQIRNTCSRFFLFLESEGISQPSEITHNTIKSFFIKDLHASSKAKDRCNNEISYCLKYMAAQGLVPKTLGITLNKFVIPDLLIVATLPESERQIFSRFFNSNSKDIRYSMIKYDTAAKQLMDLHKKQKYSSYIRKLDRQATRDFRIFMDANLLAYSNELAIEWLEFKRAKWSRAKYLAFRRTLLGINEILCKGTLSTSCFSTHEPKYLLPGWGEDLLAQYLQERVQEGCATSTLDMIKNSCSRFIVFLDNYGIVNATEITPKVVKDFHSQDSHSTMAGKNAYAIKIRGFIRFLARKGLVPGTLELAVSTELAPHTSIVTILSDNQINTIYTFRQNANRPIELRNVAIIMLGLRMGLRASDIANLKLTDISWKESSISFIQQKTSVHLKLPLPVDVGNSLYRYICEGRPQSDSPHIFIHHRAPYYQLGRSTFGRLLKVVVAQSENEAIYGFHITRKTFASKLLASGNPVTTIASVLGHVGTKTIDEYLATNENKMRLCAIGLKGIEYSGGLGL